jgi:predicted phage terminase large subunit-like protein
VTKLIKIDGMTVDPSDALLQLDRADCEESLAAFVRLAWHIVEPGQAYVHGWHIDALCAHLEAVTAGEEIDGVKLNRLLINIPPGTMKSLLVGVFWPAWEWGPQRMPHLRYLCASHSQNLAIRDNVRMRRLVVSEWYQACWPHVSLAKDQNAKLKFENTSMGFREAVAAGTITGSRGDRVIIDDPHSVESAASEQQRQSTLDWFLEAVPTRLNSPKNSAIIVIMQRLHEEDVSGTILDKALPYTHLMLPMEFEADRACATPVEWWPEWSDEPIPFADPRTVDGELLFPERFPADVVERDKAVMGPYAVAGQLQQRPEPRGGGIIKREWWQLWEHDAYPAMDFIVASLDTAYTTKSDGDYSALTIWGVFSGDVMARSVKTEDGVERAYSQQHPRVMLMSAWAERLELHELVKKTADSCRSMKVDRLLIENKAAGISVAQEIRRLFGHEDWAVMLIDPKSQDKLSRLYSIQHLFAEGMVFSPDRAWADKVMTQVGAFPRGKHDDLVDTVSQALRHMRELGMLTRGEEWTAQMQESMRHIGKDPAPLYGAP